MKALSSAGCAPDNFKKGSYTPVCVDSAVPFMHSTSRRTELSSPSSRHGYSIPKRSLQCNVGGGTPTQVQSKSDNSMPAICVAGNLFSCSKQSSVQCTNPCQQGSFDMLLNGNNVSADLVSYCIQTCCEGAAATVS